MSASLDRIEQLARQLAEQQAVIMRELRTLSTRVEALAARTRPAEVAEPKVRPYDAVHQCTCSAGWILDEQTSTAHRCPRCHPQAAAGPRPTPVPPPVAPEHRRAVVVHPTSSELL